MDVSLPSELCYRLRGRSVVDSRGCGGQAEGRTQGADTNKTGVSARRRTRTGQERRRGGGHRQDRSVGAEADTDRTGASARGRTRRGQEHRRGGGHRQDRTDDSITVSKHKLIREEKRERKQKRKRTRDYIQDATGPPRLSNNNNPTNKNHPRSTTVPDHGLSLDTSE